MYDFLYKTDTLMTFILVVARITSIISTAPVFGSNMIKPQVKMFLGIATGILIFPSISVLPMQNLDPMLIGLLLLKEILIGIITGMLSLFLFTGVQLGGQIIGFQMGLSMANILDPQSNVQLSLVSQLKNIAMILIFIAIGGHRLLLGAIFESFKLIPLGIFTIDPSVYFFPVKIFSYVYFTALKIVSPLFVVLLTTHVIMGIMGRLVPQLNLLIIGFPIQISIGLSVLGISMNYFYVVFERLMHKFFIDIAHVFRMIGG